MKRFEDILKRQKKGEFGELWAETEDTHLLPAHSESTEKLNACLERTYGFDLKPDFDLLENIVKNGQATDADEMNEIYQRVTGAEETAEEFISYGLKRKSAFRKVAQASVTGSLFDHVLACLADDIPGHFSREYVQMKEVAKTKAIKEVATQKDTLDYLIHQFNKINALCKDRGLTQRAMSKPMRRFVDNRSKIGVLDKNIESLFEKYESIDMSDKKSKSCLKKLYSDDFRRITKECRNAEHYEGEIKTERLGLLINYLIGNFRKMHDGWLNLCRDNADLKKAARYADSEDLKKLKALRNNLSSQKYDFYADFTHFSAKVNEYRNLVKQFNDKFSERIKQDDVYQRELKKQEGQAKREEFEKKARLEQEKLQKEKAVLEERIESEKIHGKKAIEEERTKSSKKIEEEKKKTESERKKHEQLSYEISETRKQVGYLQSKLDSSEKEVSRAVSQVTKTFDDYRKSQEDAGKYVEKAVAEKVAELSGQLKNYVEAQNGEKEKYKSNVEKQVAELGSKVEELLKMKKTEGVRIKRTRYEKIKKALENGGNPKKTKENRRNRGYGSWYDDSPFDIFSNLKKLDNPRNVYLIGLSSALNQGGINFVKRLNTFKRKINELYSCKTFAQNDEDLAYLDGLRTCLGKWFGTRYLSSKFEDPITRKIADNTITLLEKYVEDSRERIHAA